MVNSFYTLSEFISKVSLSHPNVNAFTMGDIGDIDMKKHTQFGLVHLMVNDVVLSSGKITYNVTMFIMDKPEDITVESTGISNSFTYDYNGVSNENDIYNTTLEILNDIYSYLLRNPDALDYNIDGDATCTPFKERFNNLLAGWGADFSITVGNQNSMCVLNP